MTADAELESAICERVRELLARAIPLCQRHRAQVPDPTIRFNLTGLAAGQMRWFRRDRTELRFNLQLAQGNRRDFLAHTVTHEVAHLLTAACHGRTRPHGPEWRSTMQFLGVAAPEPYHRYPVDERTVRRQRRWSYRCSCRSHSLSTTRHRRVQNGTSHYVCRYCRTDLAWQQPPDDDVGE